MLKPTFNIYKSVGELPTRWNTVAQSNVFLQTHYLNVLEESAPVNMQCFYIGIFENNELIGVSLAQYLDLNKLESFGERDKCLKTAVRNFVFKNFASHVLFLGNNMITGQNGYAFSKEIDFEHISEILTQTAKELTLYFKNKGIKIHLVSFKDFYEECSTELKKHDFAEAYEFNAQPNMIFYLDEKWKNADDYIAAFSKKYRDQYKRAHKKFDGIQVKNLTYEEIARHEKTLYNLYHYVAKNAPFNTFFLSENHFSTMKKQCQSNFLLFGYFLGEKLVGFHTLLLNGTVLETYFLGYDAEVQKENMLYLNMLYNMTEFGIEHGFKKIIFGRTALEIKSSIGAVPVKMSGFLYHNNSLINKYISKIFPRLEPEMEWQQRHPFR
ncbi:MAG: GNAT family N-acetyltransferase [Flavobacteriales bacterium]|nr:GNAT family N-acetyltransferase [Flavobacteriales bacterium]